MAKTANQALFLSIAPKIFSEGCAHDLQRKRANAEMVFGFDKSLLEIITSFEFLMQMICGAESLIHNILGLMLRH